MNCAVIEIAMKYNCSMIFQDLRGGYLQVEPAGYCGISNFSSLTNLNENIHLY